MNQKAARGEEGAVHALVLSGCGCGSTEAFEVGAMKVLLAEGAPHLGGRQIDPAIYCGSALGAFNAAVMASQIGGDTASALRYLERAWLEDLSSTPTNCGNGVYRLRGNPLTFLNPRCYVPQPLQPFIQAFEDGVFLTENLIERFRTFFSDEGQGSWIDRLLSIPDLTVFFDMAPLQSNLRKHVDFEALRRSAKELIVIATDWQQGKPRAFLKREMTGERGYDILQASAAYLLVFPFVTIDGRLYGGGPGSMATPLKPVIDLYGRPGRELVVHVIYLVTPIAEIPLSPMTSALAGVGRYFSMNEVFNIKNDVEYGPDGDPGKAPRGAATSVTIHSYRPRSPVMNWVDLANFERRITAAHIAEGRASVLHHDCVAEGCILGGARVLD
jgi:predicted acylesterase/phospholipase RssA